MHFNVAALQKLDLQSPSLAQLFVSAQAGAPSLPTVPAPPQSTSVSPPYFVWSAGEGTVHLLETQRRLVQSPPIEQALFGAQAGALVGAPPPQSTSVSEPFFTPSVALGAEQRPLVQTSLVQSVFTTHFKPVPQASALVGAPPPQSTSVSVPFCTESEDVGALHVSFEPQTLLAQSVAAAQPPPVAHGAQLPPQSTPVSVPFLIVSTQLAAWQTCEAQWELVQSVAALHSFPSPQGPHGPPQSMSVSISFFTPSVHVDGTHLFIWQASLVQSVSVVQA